VAAPKQPQCEKREIQQQQNNDDAHPTSPILLLIAMNLAIIQSQPCVSPSV
jgi:hypothetical protein